MVRDRIDVKENRAGDMGGKVFSLGIAVLGRKIVGAVDDDDVRFTDRAGEPFGGLEPSARWGCCGHRVYPGYVGNLAVARERTIPTPAARAGSACPFSRSEIGRAHV